MTPGKGVVTTDGDDESAQYELYYGFRTIHIENQMERYDSIQNTNIRSAASSFNTF